MTYPLHTIDSAPAAAKESLAAARKAYGFVPNLLAVMAEAPTLLKGYGTLIRIFDETSLTPSERQVVLLATSAENECDYCVAAHSVIAQMQKVPEAVVQALRDGTPIADPRLEALRRLTVSIVQSRGWPAAAELEAFLAAGYSQAQVLEVVLGVGAKTLSNYVNHLADTPLDGAFAKAAWAKAA
jgi:uncharacterized peroxidase-related enzyme